VTLTSLPLQERQPDQAEREPELDQQRAQSDGGDRRMPESRQLQRS